MEIPVNQFEQYIDETILKRGLSYFKNGYVSEVEEISPGMYEAIVEGSKNYTVLVNIKNEIIKEHVCNCPYDFGPVCKHVAAVLFYLHQDELEIKPKKPKVQGEKKKKRQTKAEQIVELLNNISHDDLKQFVIEKTTQDRSFRDLFLSSFAHLNKNESKEQYSKLVKSILRSASGRYGFIDWSAARRVGNEIILLIEAAQKQVENNNLKSAFLMSTAIMEEMFAALQYSDDSNGDIGSCVYAACEVLYDISECDLPEEIRKTLFNYCKDAFDKNIYAGWDWHTDMLEIASQVMKSDAEFDTLMLLMDKPQSSDYTQETIQDIKYQILLKIKGKKVANEYLERNISNSKLRIAAITDAIANKDFNKAENLAKDGIKQDEKEKPGLAKEWYDWLLKIAQATNDKEKIVKYARYLYIDNFRSEQDYYQILKQHIPSDNWTKYVNNIITDIKSGKSWRSKSLIPSIYIREQWWDKLFELVKESPDLSTISQYDQYLSKDYAQELSEMYAIAIVGHLERNTGRNHYQTACRYLRRIIKLGNRPKADALIAQFRNDYPKRKALLEELDKV